MHFDKNDVTRFKSKFTIDENGCHIWNAVQGKDRYGAFKLNGKKVDAHRVAYMLFKDEIPNGLFVCHKCDVKSCVNPDHLFVGTSSDNMIDCKNKGRLVVPKNPFPKGHIPKNSTITKDEANSIKEKIKNKTGTLKVLALELQYPYQLIRDINCGRIYKNI